WRWRWRHSWPRRSPTPGTPTASAGPSRKTSEWTGSAWAPTAGTGPSTSRSRLSSLPGRRRGLEAASCQRGRRMWGVPALAGAQLGNPAWLPRKTFWLDLAAGGRAAGAGEGVSECPRNESPQAPGGHALTPVKFVSHRFVSQEQGRKNARRDSG